MQGIFPSALWATITMGTSHVADPEGERGRSGRGRRSARAIIARDSKEEDGRRGLAWQTKRKGERGGSVLTLAAIHRPITVTCQTMHTTDRTCTSMKDSRGESNTRANQKLQVVFFDIALVSIGC